MTIETNQAVAELYEKRYRASSSHGLFSQHGDDDTPLLTSLNKELSTLGGKIKVVEVGAGPGLHAMSIALNVPEAHVVAVDTSSHAIFRLHHTLSLYEGGFASGSRVIPFKKDIFEYLALHQPGTIHGIHGNSWGHFLPDDLRAGFYRLAHEVQPTGGLLAVSQKDCDDALLHQSSTVIVSEDEKGIRATPADGITRIFYKTPEAAAGEICQTGYKVLDVFNWSIRGYDFPQNPELEASFVGVLAQAA